MPRNLSFQDVENLTKEIIKKLDADNFKPHLVSGFSRGGLVPAIMLSHHYKCKFIPLEISLRDDATKKTDFATISLFTHTALRNENVLIVDDICDTGETFSKLYEFLHVLKDEKATYIRTAALQERYTSTCHPTYVGEHILDDEWQIYPWEME
jgi:hypoxanthine phosphoribosyltransferase